MKERPTQILLVTVAAVLLATLARPAWIPTPALAQTAPAAAPVLGVDENMVYILRGNELSVYWTDLGVKESVDVFETMTPAKKAQILKDIQKNARILLIARRDISK